MNNSTGSQPLSKETSPKQKAAPKKGMELGGVMALVFSMAFVLIFIGLVFWFSSNLPNMP